GGGVRSFESDVDPESTDLPPLHREGRAAARPLALRGRARRIARDGPGRLAAPHPRERPHRVLRRRVPGVGLRVLPARHRARPDRGADAARRPGPPPARLRADAARERARRGPPPPPQAADRGGRPAESERPRVLPERWLRVLRRGRARLRPPRALGARRRPRASAGNHSVSEIYGVLERPGARVFLRPFAPGDE